MLRSNWDNTHITVTHRHGIRMNKALPSTHRSEALWFEGASPMAVKLAPFAYATLNQAAQIVS